MIWIPAIALAACGTTDDRRPRTVEYVTQAILAPNCGNAQCHSQFRQELGYAFDTVENARPSLIDLVGPIQLDARGEPVGSAADSRMMNVLTRTIDPMPYDQPLPDADQDLIARWIDFGAPGAQCNPNKDGGTVCIGTKVYQCQADFNYGGQLEDCAAMSKVCGAGACR
jgi:hypothetical protein